MVPAPHPPTAEQALTLEIIDALCVVAPRDWQRIELKLARGSHGQVRVADQIVHLAVDAPRAKPSLGLEVASMQGAVNEALFDLLQSLDRVDVLPPSVVAERTDNGYRLTIHGDDRRDEVSVEVNNALLDLLIFTDELLDALCSVEKDFEPRQLAFSEEIAGHDDWEYDAGTSTLLLKRGVLPWRTLRAVPVGSYAYDSEHWLWAWGNRSLSPEVTRAAKDVQASAAKSTGMGALRRVDLPCTEAFAVRLAALAADRMGARGIYGAPFGPGVMMLAVLGA